MAKRKAGSQTVSLTPDHKKSGIDPIYLVLGGMPYIVEKLLTRATTLLQIALRSKVYLQSYGGPKLRESHLGWFRDSHLGVLGKKSHLDVASMANHRVYYKGEGGGFPPSTGHGESCVSVLLVARPNTKGAPTMH